MFNRFVQFFALAVALVSFNALSAQEATPEMMPDQSLLTIPANTSAVAFTPDGHYAYAIVEGAINGYSVGADGTSALIEGSPFDVSGISYQPFDLVVSSDGTTLYIANDGFVGRSLLIPITLWTIDPQTGGLSPASTPRLTVVSDGTGLSGIGITGAGQVYVVNPGLGMVQGLEASLEAASNIQTLQIAPYRRDCVGMMPMFCLVILDEDGVESLFYQAIEGFDHTWGTTSTLRVRTERVENPPADASSLRYILEAVIEETRLTSMQFDAPASMIAPEADESFSLYLQDTRFICAAELDCEAFRAAILQSERIADRPRGPLGARLMMSFIINPDPTQPLILTAWEMQ